jgi:hypothetical protein
VMSVPSQVGKEPIELGGEFVLTQARQSFRG